MLFLDLNTPPTYLSSNNRQFLPGEKHITRSPKYNVLILMYKGILRFCEDGVPMELAPGQYYIQLAGKTQEGKKESDRPNYFYIHFQGEFSEEGHLPVFGSFNTKKMLELTRELGHLSFDSFRIDYQRCFYSILSLLYSQGHIDSDAEKIRNYLICNFEKNITIKDLEKLVFLSQNQIINVFKAQYHTTPYQYLIQYRLDKACELLLSTTRSINLISESVGFNEYSSFFRLFRAQYGVSPQEFRKISDKASHIPGVFR